MTKTISISVALSLLFCALGAYLVYNYLPQDEIISIRGNNGVFGSSVTTINGSDTIKGSRAIINTNFANLNEDKVEYSTTTMKLLTSIPNLATVGTITSGTWSGTTLTVAKGGTGSTTLQTNGVLLGNGTGVIKAVPNGANGSVLTLTAGVPTWGSGAIDQSLNYNWTGNHHFRTGTTTLHGFTVAQDLLIASGTTNKWPTASTTLANKGYVDTTAFDSYYYATGGFDPGGGTTFETDTFTHGLGGIPRMIKVTARQGATVSNTRFSEGIYNGTTYATVYLVEGTAVGADTNNIIYLDSGIIATSTLSSTEIKIKLKATSDFTNTAYLLEAWR